MIDWMRRVTTTAAAAVLGLMAFVALPGSAQAAAGLNGAYYSFTSAPNTVANTLSMMAAAPNPTATFLATTICYPNCGGAVSDTVGLASFLGSNATNLSTNVANMANHGIDLTGYIYIASAGTQTFSLGSDDGSMMWVNGAVVVNNDNAHGNQTVTGAVSLAQGWQQIRIVQFENGGDTALTAMLNGTAMTSTILSSTSPVPEPVTWGMMVIGFGATGLLLRRRRSGDRLRI